MLHHPLPEKPQPAAAFWRLAPRVALHWRRWDTEWVVYDQGSGQTHLTDTLTAMTLMALEATSCCATDIGAWIAGELEITDQAGLTPRVLDALDGLQRMGLVDQVHA